MKIITSLDMNTSYITSNKPSSSYEHLNANLMTLIVLQSHGKSPQFNKHLSSVHLKVNTQLQIITW